MSNIYKPYTYLIGWSKLDKWYYGVEYKNSYKGIANPANLWTTYFTSSKYVQEMRTLHGEPDVIQIRKVFDDAKRAFKWEEKVLNRLKVVNANKWLNKSDKLKISKEASLRGAKTKKPWKADDYRRTISANTGKNSIKYLYAFWENCSEDEKRKIIKNKNYKKHSEHTKMKMRKPHYSMRGSNHSQAKKIIINGKSFGTIKDAIVYFGFNNGVTLNSYLTNPNNRGAIINDKYYKSLEMVCREYNVTKSIVIAYLNGTIDKLEYPKCKHCNTVCKSLYLLNRWHEDNCKGINGLQRKIPNKKST